jgi:type IV pilus assembly protein PilC
VSKTFQLYQWSGIAATGDAKNGYIIANGKINAHHWATLQHGYITHLKKANVLTRQRYRLQAISMVWLQQLSALLSSGIALVSALDILSNITHRPMEQWVSYGLARLIEEGHSFTQALSHAPNMFNGVFCQLIHIGERSGTLETILQRLLHHQAQSLKLWRATKKALSYPGIVLGIATAITSGILIFLVPKMAALFASFGKQLPGPTLAVLKVSDWIISYGGYVIISIMIIGALLYKCMKQSERVYYIAERFALKIPWVGKVYANSRLTYFFETLSLILQSGFILTKALQLLQMPNSIWLNQQLRCIHQAIQDGASFYEACKRHTQYWPAVAYSMIGIGEESGSLEERLQQTARWLMDDLVYQIEIINQWLEPVLIVVVGGLVGFILIALYLPIFKLGSILR